MPAIASDNAASARDHLDKAMAALRLRGENAQSSRAGSKDPEKLLSTAEKLCAVRGSLLAEPVRTIHHLSCTGGTLLSKCIASMSNVLLLNEIDYSSDIIRSRKHPQFTPTDLISILHQSDAGDDPDIVEQLFVSDISLLLAEQTKIGRVLVLRDHSHSHFLVNDVKPERPTLLELARQHFAVKSMVSVRDPVDSYASMALMGWHKHFSPSTFDEYCRRYILFLDRHKDVPVIKYEDFVEEPKSVMQEICRLLELEYFSGFESVYDSFHFSGDSGRKGGEIKPRARRPFLPAYVEEIAQSENYQVLRHRLGYGGA